MTLVDSWLQIFPEHPAVGEDLIARWSEPHRHYHTAEHLTFVLSIVDKFPTAADDLDAVRLAAWFHDCVYDPRRTDNEIRSAELAATVLGKLDVDRDRIAEIVRLVWLTTRHNVEEGDRNGALLCDADLAILATEQELYADYAAAVRQEYAHVPDDAFRAGRIAVLGKLLELPQLYHLAPLREAWETRARANVAAEISELRASGGAAQLV
jgi:predicted metal-dependent HD superfamily phosphohydrolase